LPIDKRNMQTIFLKDIMGNLESIRQENSMKYKESCTAGRPRTSGGDMQYIAFYIMNEVYGVPVLKVQEIIRMKKITSLPELPPFVKGFIDLRGVPVPVIDMRLKFNLGEAKYSNFTVIIIIEVRGRLVGMIVDSVSDVLNVRINSIHETPSFRAKINTKYIQGIGQIGEMVVIILDSEMILDPNEFERICKISEIAQASTQR
jgi:purine-binding chemotaxis protein CheW